MINKYDSYYQRLANQTLDWFLTDSKFLYDKNIKENYDVLKSNGWIDNQFTYKINSHGFRSEEFTEDPTIMALGCSTTFGIGLPADSTWPEIVAKRLNMRCANLGMAGSSMNTAFRLALGYIDKIKPQVVICLKPDMFRFEILRGQDIAHIHPRHIPYKLESFYEMWTQNNFNAELNSEKNLLAIQMLCQSRNIKFLSYELDGLFDTGYKKHLARDLMHFGTIHHTNFADKVVADMHTS